MNLTLYHCYPDLLDLYGDRGNMLALAARCRWRGIETEIRSVSIGGKIDFDRADILFLGGGSDREQLILVEDLNSKRAELKDAIEDGLVLLTICGGYQLLGNYYLSSDGKKMPGLGILDLYTVAGRKRLIGNVIVEMAKDLQQEVSENYGGNQNAVSGRGLKQADCLASTLVGFENHSGKTFLGTGLKPLGRVLKGNGNNGRDSQEGVRYKNTFGTYLHGPLLPKNPHLADLLLCLALRRRGLISELAPLEDGLEKAAHQAVIKRFFGKKNTGRTGRFVDT